MSAEAIARLRRTLNDNDAFAPGGVQMLVDRADLRALLDAHAALEATHAEALDALERVHRAEQSFAFDGKGAELSEAWEHVVAVLAKAGRRE